MKQERPLFSASALTSALQQQSIKRPDHAVVLGTGMNLRALGTCLYTIPYTRLFPWAQPSIAQHTGQIEIYTLHGESLLVLSGRFHLYEGYSAEQVSAPMYLLEELNIKKVILCNAAGALRDDYSAGELMLISDHINFTGHNPLMGKTNPFVGMSNAYCSTLQTQIVEAAQQSNIKLHRGIYAGVLGPSLETSAERRALAQLGGDAVGMSTVIECIAANYSGMQVGALSVITNSATGDEQQQDESLDDILAFAKQGGEKIAAILDRLIQNWN